MSKATPDIKQKMLSAFPGLREEEVDEALDRLGRYLEIATSIVMREESGCPQEDGLTQVDEGAYDSNHEVGLSSINKV